VNFEHQGVAFAAAAARPRRGDDSDRKLARLVGLDLEGQLRVADKFGRLLDPLKVNR
jgi:hypothetical protein